MAPKFTLKRKHSEISESTPNITRLIENVLDSPTKRMRMECPLNDEQDPINTSIRESCPIPTNLDKEEENEVLVILIQRDEDTTTASEVEREAETAFTTDSELKDSHPSYVPNHDDSEEKKRAGLEQTKTSGSEHSVAAFEPSPNDFYLGSGSLASSRSPSPPLIFLIPLQSKAAPSTLSNIFQGQQQEDSSAPSQPNDETTPFRMSSHADALRTSSPPSASIFEALQTLRRKYHPSPNGDRSRRSLNIYESSEVLDETEDANEEDEDLDLIWAMFNGSASIPAAEAGVENQPQYPIYIEEMDVPGLEETVTTEDADGDDVAPESHNILWEDADGHLSPEPPAFSTFRTHIQEEEEEEDPETRLKRLVQEGEMGSDDGT